MYNITLISTEHREAGKCNSAELYKIIESINPDVIFEEEPNDDKYQAFYKGENSNRSLEIQCIMKYMQDHDIKHIPVDINPNQYLTFKDWDFMFGEFKKYTEYKNLEKEHCALRNIFGFSYLNSKKCFDLFNKTKIIEKQIIVFSGIIKNELQRIYNLFHKEHDYREIEMLNNIYNYSKENQYNQAVFLLGYAHRNSIQHKIEEIVSKEKIKLNWIFYSDPSYY